jgi:putative endonuclease
MVRCADGSLYCGYATDLAKRESEHNGDALRGAKYTRARRPVVLVYSEVFETRSGAMKREAEVKTWAKDRKERLITEAERTREGNGERDEERE